MKKWVNEWESARWKRSLDWKCKRCLDQLLYSLFEMRWLASDCFKCDQKDLMQHSYVACSAVLRSDEAWNESQSWLFKWIKKYNTKRALKVSDALSPSSFSSPLLTLFFSAEET